MLSEQVKVTNVSLKLANAISSRLLPIDFLAAYEPLSVQIERSKCLTNLTVSLIDISTSIKWNNNYLTVPRFVSYVLSMHRLPLEC